MDWNIPLTSGEPLTVSLEANTRIFVVGPNGSGKSALIQHAVTSLGAQNVKRIAAHRQTWLGSAAISMTPQSRRTFGQNRQARETNPVSRWQEWSSDAQISSVLFDLTAKENDLARRIMDGTYSNNLKAVETIVANERPVFEQINELLEQGGFPVTIRNSEGEEILAQNRIAGEQYSMAQMSDGERNAAILAANVLTVRPGTVLLIDEPERHLHRSIMEPFLSALFAQRQDCPFIISTHEIGLPLANPEASVIVVRSCVWSGEEAAKWEATLLEKESGLPEDLKRSILGSRRKILFIEGEPQSLDLRLYSTLFPNISVIPAGSSDDVIKAVTGLRNSQDFHDVESFGLIDGDNLSRDYVQELSQRNVYALSQYSVESLYYCPDAMKAVADRQAESLEKDAGEMIEAARSEGLAALSQEGEDERMAARRCEREVREQIQFQMPDWKSIANLSNSEIEVDVKKIHCEELNRYRGFLSERNLEKLVARYPVRDTGALNQMARQFQLSRVNYERTLLARVRDDAVLADRLRAQVGPLSNVLT